MTRHDSESGGAVPIEAAGDDAFITSAGPRFTRRRTHSTARYRLVPRRPACCITSSTPSFTSCVRVRLSLQPLAGWRGGVSAQCEQWSTSILAACRIGMGRLAESHQHFPRFQPISRESGGTALFRRSGRTTSGPVRRGGHQPSGAVDRAEGWRIRSARPLTGTRTRTQIHAMDCELRHNIRKGDEIHMCL
jgi:hypothetical protein